MTSIHAGIITEVHEMPISEIIRPFQPELEEKKVRSLMKTLSNPETADQVPPIDVFWIKGREGGNYYYSFGGCHRYTAHQRLKSEFIKVKLVEATVEVLKCYLGSSTPDLNCIGEEEKGHARKYNPNIAELEQIRYRRHFGPEDLRKKCKQIY